MTTKAAQIMALAARGLTTRQIACEVYQISDKAPHDMLAVPMAYVRTVLQRKGTGMTDSDRRWREANKATLDAYRRDWHKRKQTADPAWYEAHKRRCAQRASERWRTDPEYRAHVLNYQRLYKRERCHAEPEFRERVRASSRAYYRRKRDEGVAESTPT